MQVRSQEFGCGGLNTKAGATGLPFLECTALQDMRLAGLDWLQREGIVHVRQLDAGSDGARAMDFDGVNEHCSAALDVKPWTLGLYWTLELAIELDVTSGTQGILCVGDTTPAIILDVTSSNIRLRVWDSAATLTTVTVGAAAASVQTVFVSRNGATISTRLNNGTAVTGAISSSLNVRTPAGDLRVARDDGTNYMDGTVDYVRLFSIVKSDHKDRLLRLAGPRAAHVLADYDFNESSGGLVYDRSRYEAHLITQNSPTEVATLCHNPASIRALSMMADENQRKQLLAVVGGGRYYIGGVD